MVNETADVKLICKAEGNPVPEVKFTFNGSPLNFESKYDKYTKEIWMSLRNMTKRDNGTYACYLNETMQRSIDIIIRCKSAEIAFRLFDDNKNSLTCLFHNLDGPIMLSESKNLTVDELDTANLVCSIEKYPKPNIMWKNVLTGEIIDANSYTYINSKTVALVFERATRNNSGLYACFEHDTPHRTIEFGLFIRCI